MNKLKQPNWWRHPEATWEQLVESFNFPRGSELEDLCDNRKWYLLNDGVTNFSYRVSLKNKDYFVQLIDHEKLSRLPARQFIPVNKVFEQSDQLYRWLAPCRYESEQLRIFDWIDAGNTSAAIFDDPNVNSEFCEFLSVLHSSNGSLPVLDMYDHLNHYFQIGIAKRPDLKLDIEVMFKRALTCAKHFVASNDCHNDLSPGNVLFSGQLHIVDWEYACISDPLFELAGVSFNFGMNTEQEERLILNYSEKTNVNPNYKKFNEMKELYLLVYQLWSI